MFSNELEIKSLIWCRARVKKALELVRSKSKKVENANDDSNFQVLKKCGRDLVEQAMKLDPVTGRDEEIHRVIRILSRRTKNNPVLVGEPGVGKTAVVEDWLSALPRAMCQGVQHKLSCLNLVLFRSSAVSVQFFRS